MAKKNVEVPVQAVAIEAKAIAPKTIGDLWALIDARFKALEDRLTLRVKEGNGRGPLSTRAMTVEDAKKVMLGDMKKRMIKDCAKELGLSYGQVYSARNGYTFKEQYAEMVANQKAAKAAKK